MNPVAGRFYRTPDGVIVQALQVDGVGQWLARFVAQPLEANRAEHRQWVPWWDPAWWKEVASIPPDGGRCTCGACAIGKAVALVPLGAKVR